MTMTPEQQAHRDPSPSPTRSPVENLRSKDARPDSSSGRTGGNGERRGDGARRWRRGARGALVWGGLVVGVSVLGSAGAVGCGPDREQLAKEVHERVRADLDRRIQQEVTRRLQQELPKLEARLRARLDEPGTRVAPNRRAGGAPPRDPGARRAEPPTDPRRAGGADAGASAAGPPAVPPDLTEVKAPEIDPQGLHIERVLVARKVEDRKPVGEATTFALADERVYCYVDAKNPKGPERKLQVVWHHNGKEFHRVKLRVGEGHVWRTWAYVRLRKSHVGNWRCGVYNEQGQLMNAVGFAVKE